MEDLTEERGILSGGRMTNKCELPIFVISEQSDIAPWGEISWSGEWSADQVSQVALGADQWSYEEIQLANIDKYIWELSRNTVDELRVIWHLGWSGDQPAILPFCKTFGGENSRCSQNLERGKIDKLQLNCEKYNWGSVTNTVHKLQEIHLINCDKYSWWIVRNTVD